MRYDVELIVRPSTILYEGLADALNYGGCLGIKVPFNLTGYDGGTITWTDNEYGDFTDTFSVVFPWNGSYTTVGLQTCRPYTNNVSGVVRITFPVTKYLELYDNEAISQNWRFADLQTFQTLGSFSRQFRVPATKNNLDAIGYLDDVNFDAAIDYFQIKLPAELRVQTLPISSGYVRVMRVITQADKIADFELTFYAESPDLFNKLTGKKLKDIEALSELNAVLDYNGVTSVTGYPYLYSLTDYGQKWDETGAEGSRSIYATTQETAPRAGDLTPSLNWQWIFEKIITEAGFAYDGPALDNILNRYYAPWINAKSLKFTDSLQSYAFKIYNASTMLLNNTPTPLASVLEDFDNGNTVSSGIFTAPVTGMYTFRMFTTWTVPSATPRTDLITYFENITTSTITYVRLFYTYFLTNNADTTNTLPPIFLTAGDQFRVLYRNSVGNITLQPGVDYSSGTGVELIDIDFMDGVTLDWVANAPDVTQADFIKDVMNMHCCVIVPDRVVANRLVISPIKDYIETGASRDWSAKLDISKDMTLTNTSDYQTRRMTFTYAAGEDYFSKIYTGLNRIYGDYKIDAYTVSESDVPNDFAKDSETKISLVTQSTPSNYIDGTGIPIPKFVDQSGNFVNPKLRCLFHAGDYEMTLFDFSTLTPDTAYVVPVLCHYELILPLFTSLDLNWAPEVPLYVQGINPLNNLFNVYWRDYLNQLYSPNARIMEAYFAMNLTDVLSFSFADRIWVKDAWWRILDVNDYKVGSAESTRVTLLKLIDAVPEVSARPDAVTDGGVIEFVDGAGNPVSATQESCERFGYTWDPVTQTCYASTSFPQNTQAVSTKSVGTSTRQLSNAEQTLVMADELNNDPSNIYTVAVGSKITMEADNSQSIAVGEQLTKVDSGRVAMFGTNVYAKHSGLHIGGGYRDGDPANSSYTGWAQSGVIVMHKKATWSASGDIFNLEIEGIPGNYLNLPDQTLWSVLMNVTIMDTLDTGNYHTGQYSFALTKQGGTAQSSSVLTIQDTGGFGSYVFTFGIDTATDPAEHRIYLEVTGAGTYPENFIVTASIIYQQGKI